MRALLAIFVLLSAVACGPSWKHQPLVGEDPEVLRLMGASPSDLEKPETVAAAESFYRALWSKSATGVWALLTEDSKTALNILAGQLDQNGKTLLNTRTFPKAGGGTVRISLAALFMVRRPTRFEVAKTKGEDATVTVRNGRGQERLITLKRERGTWKVHHTEFGDLPQAVSLRPVLLPQDMPKPEPTPEPKPEPKPEPDCTPDPDDTPDPTPPPGDPDKTPTPKPDRNPDLDF